MNQTLNHMMAPGHVPMPIAVKCSFAEAGLDRSPHMMAGSLRELQIISRQRAMAGITGPAPVRCPFWLAKA
jgi:hypothetical protein